MKFLRKRIRFVSRVYVVLVSGLLLGAVGMMYLGRQFHSLALAFCAILLNLAYVWLTD